MCSGTVLTMGIAEMVNVSSLSSKLAFVFLCGISSAAFAASDGSKGADSTGSAEVSTNVPGKIQITNLSDIDLGTWNTGNQSGSASGICVWSTLRQYSLTATGSLAGNAFGVTNGEATETTIPFSVEWTNGSDAAIPIVAGQKVSNLSAVSKSANCNGANDETSTLAVSILEADLEAAIADNYTGTVTLFVVAE